MRKRLGCVALYAVLAVVCAPPGWAQSPAAEVLEQRLMERFKAVERQSGGVLGVAVIDLNAPGGSRLTGINLDTVFAQASVIKIPVLIELFRQSRDGKFRMEDRITLRPEESVPGSGHLKSVLRYGPHTLPVIDLITAMIESSDNTATNRCIALAGMDGVNAMLEREGYKATRVRRIMLDTAAAARGDENVSTPREMARMVESIYREKAVDAEASREMLRILKLVDGDFRKLAPPGVEVAAKTGEVGGVRNEAGIFYFRNRPFVLVVMSGFNDRNENPVPAVVKQALEYFDKLNASNVFGNRAR